jgi:hypothetical protein
VLVQVKFFPFLALILQRINSEASYFDSPACEEELSSVPIVWNIGEGKKINFLHSGIVVF